VRTVFLASDSNRVINALDEIADCTTERRCDDAMPVSTAICSGLFDIFLPGYFTKETVEIIFLLRPGAAYPQT
jgi:hypothetical protein